MYTRVPSGRMPRGMRVPENYSGNAFRSSESTPPTTAPPRKEIPLASPMPAPEPPTELPVLEMPPQEETTAAPTDDMPVHATPSPFGLRLPFQGLFRSSGLHIGFEELLLIGLILMISQEGKNDDLIWLLLLLLFIPQ